jgi:WD40 repeat protein
MSRLRLFGSVVVITVGVMSIRTPANADDKVDAEIRQLIEDLGDPDIPRRYQAAKRLVDIGRSAIGPLRKAAAEHPSEDVRDRAAVVVKDVEKGLFQLVRVYDGHTTAVDWRRAVTRVVLTPDGKRMVSLSGTGLILWDIDTGKIVRRFGDGFAGWALALSRDGKRVVAGGTDRTARVWDLETGAEIQKLAGHTDAVWGAALTADGKTAITGGRDRAIIVWDVAKGKEVRSFKGVRDRVRALALSPDEKIIAAGHFEQDNRAGILRLWDLAGGTLLHSCEGHGQPITSLSFSRDGKTVMTASLNGTVRLWEAPSGKEVKTLAIPRAAIEFAALADDGRTLVCGGSEPEPTVRVFDVVAASSVCESPPMSDGLLTGATMPDGHSAVVGGRDGVIRLWRWK